MATILIIDGKLSLKCAYEERFRAKEVPGARWNPNMKVWQYPSDEATIQQLMAAFPQAKVSGDVQAFLARKAEIRQHLMESKEVLWHTDAPLRDYQKAGVNFLVTAKRAILGDDMGLGKTLQAIMACEAEQFHRALIICPNTLKWVWHDEIRKWTGKNATVIGGGRKHREQGLKAYKGGYLIINYESARLHPEIQEGEWDVMICDEAHRLKNRKALQTQFVRRIKTNHAYMVTGTPMMNRTEELWSLLNILYPKTFTSFWRFVDMYCQKNTTYYGTEILPGTDEQTEDLREILQPIMIRRRKDEVLTELPAKVYQRLPVELEGRQKAMYQQMERDAIAVLSEGAIAAPVVIAQITRLRQIAVGAQLLDPEIDSSAKFRALDEILDTHLETHKVVVFSQFRQAIELLEERYAALGPVSVTGTVSQKDRTTATRRFQTDDTCRIMLSTIQAGGLGLTWTAADIVVFLDRHWTPAMNTQAEDRLHRLGQRNSVTVINLVAKDTVEEWIETLLEEKQINFNKVIETWRKAKNSYTGDAKGRMEVSD